MDCRLGDTALETLEGDTDSDKLSGDPRGVSRGVLVCELNIRPCDIPGLESVHKQI